MKFIVVITCLTVLPMIVSSHPSQTADESLRTRVKRAGSFDFIKQGIVSSIGHASANVAAGSSGKSSSSGSSSSSSSGKHYPSHHEDTKLDGWQLKKSIFNTIFQAVKAITGGVTAIKGQLIKGSGYLVSGGGKLISASGDAVTNVGKKIALSATLVKPAPASAHFAKFSGASHGSSSSGHSTGYNGHSESFTSFEAPAGHTSYGIPAAIPSTGYGAPPSYSSHTSHSSPQSYLPPSSHSSSSYSSPSHSYGVSSLEPSLSYGSPHLEVTNDHIHFETSPKHGSDASIHLSKTTKHNLQSAADVLRNILQKLPTPTSTHDSEAHHGDSYSATYSTDHGSHDNKIEQYPIPSDPAPPPFRPLKMSNFIQEMSHYGPVNAVSHSQTITTAFGNPITDYQKPVQLVDAPLVQQYQIPSHNYGAPAGLYNTNDKSPIKQYPIPPSPNSYSVYQTMTYKRAATDAPPLTRGTVKTVNDMDKHVHQQQLNHIQKTLGAEFEIQKSIGYEFNNANKNQNQIKRRIDETIAD